MQLSVVINQILGELVMSLRIFNAAMRCKKTFNPIRVPLGLHSGANIVIETWQVQPSLIFNDHVVKNHTTCHDFDESTKSSICTSSEVIYHREA
jgi:hypothetical protein